MTHQRQALPTCSIEILDSPHPYKCEVCKPTWSRPDPVHARYNVFDGNMPLFTCGTHINQAIALVATRKG